MSHSKVILPPYPVQIGSVKQYSPEKYLQEYVQCGNYAKVKKMLKKGIFPDTTNSQGQTPLFVAALLGLQKIVELLLKFRSNPNHRCFDWSTPVHAAAFSCDLLIMSQIIDAGGDLRLHDQKSTQPYDWALLAGKDESAQMIEFIDRCTIRMQALIHFYPLKPMNIDSSQDLTNRASFMNLFSPRSLSRPNKSEKISAKKACCFGFGQFCVRDNGQAGFMLTFPFIEEKSLVREESKPVFSYAAGPLMTMTNLLWGSTEVTVKGLSDNVQNKCFADLLIAEEENMSYLQHPLILQLLALSTSPSLERKQLVFERVTLGSFYSILHEKRSEYPVLHLGTIVHILLQMIEALTFLHWRGFIHRSFSSHAIQLVTADRAKISNFEYMVESKVIEKCDEIIHFPIPKRLYCWSSPEIVAGKTGTVKSDLYSFCVVMQESLTDSLPWNGVDGEAVRDAMGSGHYLTVDPALSEPYYSIVSTGIQARPKERTTQLQDVAYMLKKDLQHFMDNLPCSKDASMVEEAGREIKMQHIEEEIPPDMSYKGTSHCSYSSSKGVSSTESQSETLCDTVEQTDEMYATLHSLEKKGQNKAGDFYPQGIGSPSASLSSISNCETDTSSNSEEEDIDCSSVEASKNWQDELQILTNKLDSIEMRNKTTLDNLLYIQKFFQERNTILEEQKLSENIGMKENHPHNDEDEVDHELPLFKSKGYAGWTAVGPPLSYVPPERGSYSRSDITSATKRIERESAVDILQKGSKKGEVCTSLGSFKGKTLEASSTGQDFVQLTKRSSKNSPADPDDMMRHQYPSSSFAPDGPTNILEGDMLHSPSLMSGSQHLQNKTLCEHVYDSNNEEQTNQEQNQNNSACDETKLEKLFRLFAGRNEQFLENEDYCGISVGTKPLQDHSRDTDDSNVSAGTSYYTPEIDISVEKTEQEKLNVCEESDHTFSKWNPGPSSIVSFEKTLAGEMKKNMPGPPTIDLSTNSRSIIDVEELSIISCVQKTSLLESITSRSTEASARHSTPLGPGHLISGATSKRRSFLENQLKSPATNEGSFTSLASNKNVSSKTSDCFLSAMGDVTDYVSPRQERAFTVKYQGASNIPIKDRESGFDGDDVLPGPQCSLNKTDRRCESMEITCLINNTICEHQL